MTERTRKIRKMGVEKQNRKIRNTLPTVITNDTLNTEAE